MSNTNFSLGDTQPNRTIQKENSRIALNLCPNCVKDDQVQKVSAIVSSGTITSTYQVPVQGEIAGHKIYGTAPQTGTSKTQLAQVLSMPSDKEWKEWKEKQISRNEINEEYKRLHPQPYGKGKYYELKVGCLLLGLVGFLIGAMGLLFAINGGGIVSGIFGCMFTLLFPLSWGVVAIIFELSTPKEHKEIISKWDKTRVEYVNSQIKSIEQHAINIQRQAVINFNMLYYCYRDDVVYIPNTDFCVSANDMISMTTWSKLGQLS